MAAQTQDISLSVPHLVDDRRCAHVQLSRFEVVELDACHEHGRVERVGVQILLLFPVECELEESSSRCNANTVVRISRWTIEATYEEQHTE